MLAADLFKTDTKILIADDDPATRKMVTVFLEKSNYEVQCVTDGPSALEALLAPDAAHIAILDWMMPGLSGPDICARLRSAGLKIRPYVMILTAKTEIDDLAAGLDAGADDYLSKPFNPVELLARLRVAQRTVHYQRELHKHIDELETLAQRYHLLGEIIGQQSEPSNATPAPAALSTATEPENVGRDEVDAIMKRALTDLGLSLVNVTAHPLDRRYQPAAFTAWAGLILVKAQLWVDLLLEFDRTSATTFYEQALRRRPTSDRDILGFLAETHTIIGAAFKAALQNRGGEMLSPILSHALRTDHLERPPPPVPAERESRTYTLSDFSISLTLVRQACPVHRKAATRLHTGEILAESYPSAELSSVPLLSQGVVLNDRFIEKLATWSDKEVQSQAVPVFQPSLLARYFHADTLFSGELDRH
jgi:phosphoserine phosphatase RsbU/P